MNPHQRCLHAKVKYRNEPKQVMPKSEDLRRSLEMKPFGTEFPIIFNKSCTYITFKSKYMTCIKIKLELYIDASSVDAMFVLLRL